MGSNRRGFIKKTTTAAVGVAVTCNTLNAMSALSYRNIIGSNDRLNVAIAGLGRRLNAFKSPIGSKQSNFKLLYLCDVMESQRLKALKGFKDLISYTPKLENDIRKVIGDYNVDLLINSARDHWHTPGSIMALQAGKHVYVEKPCSHSRHENEQLVQAAKKYDKGMLSMV